MSKNNKNINVLKRLDANILEINDTYSHVVVYELIEMSWRKKGIEGTAFLVTNSDSSQSLFVMNRLSLENHIFNLKSWKNLEICKDFVFYQSDGIYGIWIYDLKDRIRFNTMLESSINKITKDLKAILGLNPNLSQPVQSIQPCQPTFSTLTHLWSFIDPHSEKLDFVNFKSRIQVTFLLLNLESCYIRNAV